MLQRIYWMLQRIYWRLQRIYLIFLIIMPLRGPSCKLRLARISAKLKFQDGPSVAIIINGIFAYVVRNNCKELTIYTLSTWSSCGLLLL